jgi:hypothetical protein
VCEVWVLDLALRRAWQAGAGPGDGPLVIDIDSFIGEVCGEQKQGASYGYTKKLGYHPLIAVRADTGEVLHIRNRRARRTRSAGSRGSLTNCSRVSAAPGTPARSSSVRTPGLRTTS